MFVKWLLIWYSNNCENLEGCDFVTKVESKIIDLIRDNILMIFLFAITFCGCILRIFGINFESVDYTGFLKNWWIVIEQGGVGSITTQVGNYNIPYQIITSLMTYLPFGPLYSYKFLSIVFDVLLAVAAALLVNSLSKKNSRFKAILTYGIVFCSLTVILNSAFWAQCDSIYVSFILFSLYFLVKDKNVLAFVFLGIAFAFKLQTVFILPVFIFYYFATRKFSILHFLIIPVVDFIMCLPAVIMGRPIVDLVNIYVEQTDYGKQISMNYPNLYYLMCDTANTANYELFKNFSIVLTFAVIGTGLSLVLYKKVNMKNRENLIFTAIWTVFTCLMFLSSMHERYAYLLDILAIIYTMITFKKVWLPILCFFISLRGYCFFLFNIDMLDIRIMSMINMGLYIYVSYLFLRDVVKNGEKIQTISENKKLKSEQKMQYVVAEDSNSVSATVEIPKEPSNTFETKKSADNTGNFSENNN